MKGSMLYKIFFSEGLQLVGKPLPILCFFCSPDVSLVLAITEENQQQCLSKKFQNQFLRYFGAVQLCCWSSNLPSTGRP